MAGIGHAATLRGARGAVQLASIAGRRGYVVKPTVDELVDTSYSLFPAPERHSPKRLALGVIEEYKELFVKGTATGTLDPKAKAQIHERMLSTVKSNIPDTEITSESLKKDFPLKDKYDVSELQLPTSK